MDGKCHIFADSQWEMLLQGCWAADGHCCKGIGKLLGNAQRYWIASGQFSRLLESRWEKSK